jgi:general secretion pathway protein G
MRRPAGFTLLELIITMALMSIIAMAVFPLAKTTVRRQQEAQLKRNLRQIRDGIDRYKRFCDAPPIPGVSGINPLDRKPDDMCYPPSLDILVEGVNINGSPNKVRFLNRIPPDPITGKSDWGTVSMQDEPEAKNWGGQNVYDVYSKSEGKALDGTSYNKW